MDNNTIIVTLGLLGVIGYLNMMRTEETHETTYSHDDGEYYADVPDAPMPDDDGDLVHTPASLDPLKALNPPVTALSPSTKNQSRDLRGDVTIPQASDHDTNDFLNPHTTDKLKFTVCASN